MFSKNVVLKTLCVAVAMMSAITQAIYQKDAGKNEWHVETLGEISDLVFIGTNQAYTLSADALLTLYDTAAEKIEWKKQLPQGENETYKLRHLGRNLIVHSNKRVTMINSAGHVIWEQPLVGSGNAVVEMF